MGVSVLANAKLHNVNVVLCTPAPLSFLPLPPPPALPYPTKFLNLFFRFDVGSKNAILLHDIEIGKLFGVDFEKIKSIARAEMTVAKIHSSTVTLPPLHLLYTR
jgi:hypothetical protein